MKNALKIGSVSGIGIFLHWTFGLLLVGLFFFYRFQGSTIVASLLGIGLILAVFACVILHELGHALTARHYGIPTKDITLYPIGGVARLQRIPEEPMKELWIALAGPAVNVVIAVVLAAAIVATGGSLAPQIVLSPDAGILPTLMWVNVVLVAFNLLPAFPMDGGRVLRALLATRMDYVKATEIAASIGQGMAILFAFAGILGNFLLLFIALFVYIGAQQEAQQAKMRSVTQGIPVRQAMMTRFQVLRPGNTIDLAVEELLAGSDQDFPVMDGEEIVGVLTRSEIVKALAEQGRHARVGDIVRPSRLVVEDTAMLDEAFEQMRLAGRSTVPVVRGGQLVGVLTLENVGELMMIASALRQAGRRDELGTVLTP